MIVKIFKTISKIIVNHAVKDVLEESRHLRNVSEGRIQRMQASLNGCNDKYLLMLKTPLDECIPTDNDMILPDNEVEQDREIEK